MAENNIARSAKTVGAGISGAAGVGSAIGTAAGISAIPAAAIIAPAIVPLIVSTGVVGAVGRWLGRD